MDEIEEDFYSEERDYRDEMINNPNGNIGITLII